MSISKNSWRSGRTCVWVPEQMVRRVFLALILIGTVASGAWLSVVENGAMASARGGEDVKNGGGGKVGGVGGGGGESVLFSFYDNLLLAHGYKSEHGLVMDLGCPSAIKYMQGRWKQPWGEDGRDGVTNWAGVSGIQGILRFPGQVKSGERNTAGHFAIRLRIPAASGQGQSQGQALTVFLNDVVVANWVGLPAGEWVVKSAVVPAGVLVDGENVLRLQFRRSFSLGQGKNGAAEVDWVTVGGAVALAGGRWAGGEIADAVDFNYGPVFFSGMLQDALDVRAEAGAEAGRRPELGGAGAGGRVDGHGVDGEGESGSDGSMGLCAIEDELSGSCGTQLLTSPVESIVLMGGDSLAYYLTVPRQSAMVAGLDATSHWLKPQVQLQQEKFPQITLLGHGNGNRDINGDSRFSRKGSSKERVSLGGGIGENGEVVKIVLSCESMANSEGRIVGPLDGSGIELTMGEQYMDRVYFSMTDRMLTQYSSFGLGVCLFDAPAIVSDSVPHGGGSNRVTKRPERVIVWIADTLSAGKTRLYNPDCRVQTPNLERAASMGALFRNATVQGNHSQTSHATIMTGTYPDVHQLNRPSQVLPKSIPTSAEWLHDRGFQTGLFSSNGYVSTKWGLGRGWDKYKNYIRDGVPSASRYLVRDVFEWMSEQESSRLSAQGVGGDVASGKVGDSGAASGERDGEGVKVMGAKPEGMYLYLVTIDPHVPYRPEPADLALYDSEPYGGRVNGPGSAQLLGDVKSGKVILTERDKVRLEALYDGAVTYNDRHLGLLMEHIDQGRDGFSWNNTALIITSDHGEEWWEHGSVGHGHSLYQELVGVPFLIVWPGGITGGTVVHQDVELVDLHATVMDLLGVDVNGESQGASLLSLARDGGAGSMNRPAIASHQDTSRSVKLGRWKYILFAGDRDYVYDLAGRVTEGENVKAQHPFVHRHMRDIMSLYLAHGKSWKKTACGQLNNLQQPSCLVEEWKTKSLK